MGIEYNRTEIVEQNQNQDLYCVTCGSIKSFKYWCLDSQEVFPIVKKLLEIIPEDTIFSRIYSLLYICEACKNFTDRIKSFCMRAKEEIKEQSFNFGLKIVSVESQKENQQADISIETIEHKVLTVDEEESCSRSAAQGTSALVEPKIEYDENLDIHNSDYKSIMRNTWEEFSNAIVPKIESDAINEDDFQYNSLPVYDLTRTETDTPSNTKNCTMPELRIMREDRMESVLETESGGIICETDGRRKRKRQFCTVCNMKFVNKKKLNEHVLTHFSDKRFNLRKRQQALAKDADFSCKICNEVFNTKKLLDKHAKSHKNKNTCNLCHAEYLNIKDFDWHKTKTCLGRNLQDVNTDKGGRNRSGSRSKNIKQVEEKSQNIKNSVRKGKPHLQKTQKQMTDTRTSRKRSRSQVLFSHSATPVIVSGVNTSIPMDDDAQSIRTNTSSRKSSHKRSQSQTPSSINTSRANTPISMDDDNMSISSNISRNSNYSRVSENSGTSSRNQSRSSTPINGKSFDANSWFHRPRTPALMDDDNVSITSTMTRYTNNSLASQITEAESIISSYYGTNKRRTRSNSRNYNTALEFLRVVQPEEKVEDFLAKSKTKRRVRKKSCSHNSCKYKRCRLESQVPDEVMQHHLRLFSCKECRNRYSDSELLDHHHYDVHRVLSRVNCPLCDLYFFDQHIVVDHLEKHLFEKSVKCKYCEKYFAVPTLLQTHLQKCHPRKDHDLTFYKWQTFYTKEPPASQIVSILQTRSGNSKINDCNIASETNLQPDSLGKSSMSKVAPKRSHSVIASETNTRIHHSRKRRKKSHFDYNEFLFEIHSTHSNGGFIDSEAEYGDDYNQEEVNVTADEIVENNETIYSSLEIPSNVYSSCELYLDNEHLNFVYRDLLPGKTYEKKRKVFKNDYSLFPLVELESFDKDTDISLLSSNGSVRSSKRRSRSINLVYRKLSKDNVLPPLEFEKNEYEAPKYSDICTSDSTGRNASSTKLDGPWRVGY